MPQSNIAFPSPSVGRYSKRLIAGQAILAASVAGLLSVGSARAGDINFTPPAAAPTGGMGTVGVYEVYNNGTINTEEDAYNSLMNPGGGSTVVAGSAPTVNFLDSGGGDHFSGAQDFLVTQQLGGPAPGSVDNLSVLYQGTIAIPTTGAYTFEVDSDDGFTLAFDNGTTPFTSAAGVAGTSLVSYNGTANGAMQWDGGRGPNDSLGAINLTAGNHPFTLEYHEGTGGSTVQLSAAAGTYTGFDASAFRIVGQTGSVAPLNTSGSWDYYEIHGTSSLSQLLTSYQQALAGTTPTTGTVVNHSQQQTIAFADPQSANAGNRAFTAFPGDTPADDDNFGAGARITLNVTPATAGKFTFDIYSDDSNQFRVLDANGKPVPIATLTGNAVGADTDGDGTNDAFTDDGACCTDTGGTFNLAAGTYTLEAVFNEQTGASGFFVYGSQGDGALQLIGDPNATPTDITGLQLVPEPTSLGLAIASGLAALGFTRRRRSA